ncbi:MAG: class I SAM-dependent methyltransferase [Actinobacteria bacterium]|nr:class I SAM-dependent methyltransferase [Actinomycetota bacterium]
MTPRLPPGVEVLPGTDVTGSWERFEVFEALHHRMRICNPMLPADLERLLDALAPAPGAGMLDLACGHGELLIRAAERGPVAGTGVDLSPWAVSRAAREARRRVPDADLRWVLGDARAYPAGHWDAVTCLGASWVWHGFTGTARAVAGRCRPGGTMAIGDLVLKPGADSAAVAAEHGRMPSLDEQAAALAGLGLTDAVPTVVPDDSFEAYDARIAGSAAAWEGPRADEHREEQRRWAEDHRRDRQVLSWVVWVARRPEGV